MSDEDVKVSFGAQVAELSAGIQRMTSEIKSFAAGTKAAVESVITPFQKLQSVMIAVAAVAAGGAVFKDIVTSTVEGAQQVRQLQKALGLTLDEANGLAGSLRYLGISTDDYIGIARKLDRQIRTNDDSLRQMGFTAKDLDLGQKGLIDKAIAKLLEYKEGVARNIAAQVLFGRSAGEAMQLAKLSIEGITVKAADLREKMGLTITQEDKNRALDYKIAMTELSITFEGIKKAIGDAVLPYLTKFAQWFRDQGPTVIQGMKDTVRTVIEFAFDVAAGFIKFAVSVANGIYNIFVIAQYLKTKLGLTTEADALASIDELGAMITKLEKIREAALKGLSDVKSSVLSDKGLFPESGGEMDKVSKGFKDAGDLLKNQNKEALKDLKTEMTALKEQSNQRKMLIEADVGAFELSQNKKFGLLQAEAEREYQEEVNLTRKKLALGGLTLDQRHEMLNKLKDLEAKHGTEVLRLNLESIKSMRDNIEGYLSNITSSFNGQLRGLLAGTTTFTQAFRNMMGDLVISFIQAIEKMVVKWVAAEAAKTLATQTGVATRTASEEAGALSSLATAFMSIAKSIAASVSQVFAGASAFFAPVAGPAAPALGASVAAVVESAAVLPALDVGGFVRNDGLAMIHKGETITPADVDTPFKSGGFAEAMKSAFSGVVSIGDVSIFHQGGKLDPRQVADALGEAARMMHPAIKKSWA